MNNDLKSPINHMLQGLAYWMSFRSEKSRIPLIESNAVFEAIEILQATLPKNYAIVPEVTKKSLPIVDSYKIDLGIKDNNESKYKCLIEFKLADATNSGYTGDVNKLSKIKAKSPELDCLVVILFRKACTFDSPQLFVDKNGKARRTIIKVGKNNIPIKTRRVCNSFSSHTNSKSRKTICLEVL